MRPEQELQDGVPSLPVASPGQTLEGAGQASAIWIPPSSSRQEQQDRPHQDATALPRKEEKRKERQEHGQLCENRHVAIKIPTKRDITWPAIPAYLYVPFPLPGLECPRALKLMYTCRRTP